MSRKTKTKEVPLPPDRKKRKRASEIKKCPDVPINISPRGSVMTPRWFWRDYIDSQTVPRHLAEQLVKAAGVMLGGQQCTPLSVCSKLCLVRTSKSDLILRDVSAATMDNNKSDQNVLNILNISRHRKFCNSAEAFTLAAFKCSTTQLEAQQKKEQKEQDESPRPRVVFRQSTPHDYELVWKPLSADPNISSALRLKKRTKSIEAPADVMAYALRHFWHDNLEIQIETKFFHVDQYVFTYFCSNFRDCHSLFLQLPAHTIHMAMLIRLYSWMLGIDRELRVDDQFIQLFIATKFLGIQFLVEQYWHTFSQSCALGLWEQNAFHSYMTARAMRCEDMMMLMTTRLRKSIIPLVASHEFLRLDINELSYMLRQDTLCVNSEDEVFFAVVRWLEFNWTDRKQHAVIALTTVRFRLLAPWLRRSLSRIAENSIIAELGHLPEVICWLWDAAKYCLAHIHFDIPRFDRCRVVNHYRRDMTSDRLWVYCEGVSHHHDLKCRYYRDLTYEGFKRYLVRLHISAHLYLKGIRFVPSKFCNTYRCCLYQKFRRTTFHVCRRPLIYVPD